MGGQVSRTGLVQQQSVCWSMCLSGDCSNSSTLPDAVKKEELKTQAAIVVQAVWRGVCGRRRAAILKEHRVQAATTIQVCCAGYWASSSSTSWASLLCRRGSEGAVCVDDCGRCWQEVSVEEKGRKTCSSNKRKSLTMRRK